MLKSHNELILVTGATGFIGKNLVTELAGRGLNVRCFVRAGSDCSLLKRLNVEIAVGDLLDPPSILRALEGVSVVYHLAATVRPAGSIYSKGGFGRLCFRTNVDGAMNLARACLAKKVERLVHYSSVASAGPGVNITEDCASRPFSVYGRSKLEGEQQILGLFKSFGLPVTVIRPGMVYGPHSGAWRMLFRLVNLGFSLSIKGTEIRMPMCYVGNLIEATIAIGETGKSGEVYFVSDESRSFGETVEMVGIALGKKSKPRDISVSKNLVKFCLRVKESFEALIRLDIFPFRVSFDSELLAAMPINWSCDTSKLLRLGYVRKFTASEGIALSVEWFRRNKLL
ncbi:MAG: NAD-dependent epimerase/dehydratase family protein [Elusimicrobiota bacterium]